MSAGAVTDVDGVRVGHWTDAAACTGCTVVLLPAGTVASGEVRGGAPATREFALLEPGRLVEHVDAVVLTGGSAFGLSAADGVVRFCEERGVGFPTSAGPVPIVVAMALFDLGEGDGAVRPGPEAGYAACESATSGAVAQGRVGAGAGATLGKWRGREHARPGGIGTASIAAGAIVVAALVAVNAYGDLRQAPPGEPSEPRLPTVEAGDPFTSTTIGVVVTNARLDKAACLLAAQSGHDGMARALSPAHTRFDGDALVCAATGTVEGSIEVVRELAAAAVDAAVRAGAAPGPQTR